MADPDSTIINTSINQKDPKEALVIAVTTRTIFNLEREHEIFLTKGKEEYVKHQQANENNPLEQGTAFSFIQAVQFVNKKLLERDPEEKGLFDVIVLSNNSPESGVRIINSVKQYGLEISKFCFVSDEDSTQYLKAHNVKLFLSADPKDVCNALQRGVSAALIFQQEIQAPKTQLRVVFDGDAVLFSDETDRVFHEKGLEEAVEYEKIMETVPMGEVRLVHQLRPYLEQEALLTVTHALITSRLDYCNTLYMGLPLKSVRRLQLVQNAAVRVVVNASRFTHITPILRQLHWLPIGLRAQFKGPMKAFALHLAKMRKKFSQEDSPIRIYLVTARSGRDMGTRAIKTLREWGLPTDEAFFMAGAPKGPILSKIQPHIFFDDNFHNIQGAQDVGIPSALVPYGCQKGS